MLAAHLIVALNVAKSKFFVLGEFLRTIMAAVINNNTSALTTAVPPAVTITFDSLRLIARVFTRVAVQVRLRVKASALLSPFLARPHRQR